MTSHLSNVIDCLYGTYIYQRNRLKKYGYTREEVFWIHFASIPFMPWFENDRNIVPLSHLIKFYKQIYNDEIKQYENSKTNTCTKYLLQDKFDSAYALAKQSFISELNLKFALDVGTRILPHINDVFRLTLAGLVIMNAKPIYQRARRHFPLGRLVRDLDETYQIEKAGISKYAAAL